MNLTEAIQACKQGHFVTHEYFDSKQSMHMYKNTLYYEDGANLSHQMDWIANQKIFQSSWSVKYKSHLVDKKLLEFMHVKNRRKMLQGDTYERCIKEVL